MKMHQRIALAILTVTVIAGVAGCSSNPGPERTPSVEEETPNPAESSSSNAETSASETPVSTVPKIRANWIVDEDALAHLYKVNKGIVSEDLDLVRAEVCNEFLRANLGSAIPSQAASVEEIEAYFEAKQQLQLAYISDRYRDDQWREDVSAAELLGGVSVCVGVEAAGAIPQEWMTAIIDDESLPQVVTVPKEYSIRDTTLDVDRTAFVTVSVEGQESRDLWRRHLWSDASQDWYLVSEQAENPYNLGWKD